MTMTNEIIVFIIYLQAVIEIIIPLILLIMVYKIYKEINAKRLGHTQTECLKTYVKFFNNSEQDLIDIIDSQFE